MSAPVGAPSGSGSVQPVGSSNATEAASTVYFHGEKKRTWLHWRIEALTASPASSTSGVSPRASRWAAAARPTGPAPMTATGRSERAVVMNWFSSGVAGLTGSAAGEAVDQPLQRVHDRRLVEAIKD